MTDQKPTDDTIVAVSSPPGRGGVGVVRISGPLSARIALEMFRHAGRNGGPGDPARGHASPPMLLGRALFGSFRAGNLDVIDHGYLVLFQPPRSFTGEETAELWTHGSPVVLRKLVEEAVARGARPATPGEFSLRAFLNGRIDVTQAEAIRDLIEARTAFQAQVAHDQVAGRISREVDRLKERLLDLVARLEASIEFSEEADAERFAPDGGAATVLRTLRLDLERLGGTYDRGRLVRDGAAVALAGLPNVGKSSLFNRLLEEERAIVTPIAGTTRDLLEETLDLGGIPVRLIDAAGLHEPNDEADAEAVRRARGALEAADLVLLVLDWSRALGAADLRLLGELQARRSIVVLNKCDLSRGLGVDQVLYLRKRHAAFEVSARSGEGIQDLRRRLTDAFGGGAGGAREEIFLTNVRHRDLVLKAAAALGRAEGMVRDRLWDECTALELKEALDRLGEITGAIGVEGIYERIFRDFCIGK
jgi:tRNA modification GTPase